MKCSINTWVNWYDWTLTDVSKSKCPQEWKHRWSAVVFTVADYTPSQLAQPFVKRYSMSATFIMLLSGSESTKHFGSSTTQKRSILLLKKHKWLLTAPRSQIDMKRCFFSLKRKGWTWCLSKSIWYLWPFTDLYGAISCFCFYNLKQVPSFVSRLGECCTAVLLQSSWNCGLSEFTWLSICIACCREDSFGVLGITKTVFTALY